MSRAKLTAKLNAIAKLLEETKAAVAAIPDAANEAVSRMEDMDAELAEVITCLRTVRSEARDTTEVYA